MSGLDDDAATSAKAGKKGGKKAAHASAPSVIGGEPARAAIDAETSWDDFPTAADGWVPDVLPGFERLTLEVPDDDGGPVVATLVRRIAYAAADPEPGASEGFDVLYVHGWLDYFMQVHLAEYWERQGGRFYAVDLRRYGRSLRPGQSPGFVTDLARYDEEIEAALAVIGHGEADVAAGRGPARRLVLMGHSTGGLTLSLWLDRHPGRAEGLVLNSPWLEFQPGEVGRKALEPAVRAHARLAPAGQIIFPIDQTFYARSISNRFDGEWDYDATWRPDAGWKPTPAWLAAIFDGHEAVAKGLHIDVPVLVLLSARSVLSVRWLDTMLAADSVLDVAGVARRVPNLGAVTTLVQLDGALHDVTLSAAPVRERAWAETTRWLRGYVTDTPASAAGSRWRRWLRRRVKI